MAARETKPIWNSSTFLVYTGGLTVLIGAVAGLGYLLTQYHGHGEMALWSLLFLVILYGIANVLLMRDRPIAAGIFAWVSVLAWAIFLYFLFQKLGWNVAVFSSSFRQWSWARMLLWILILVAAWYDRRRFRFPFIRLISAVVFWVFIVDLLTSGRGTWFVVVTLLLGVLYLLVGNVTDKPSAFWLHVVGGALIGGALLHWFGKTDTDFAVISFFALVYVWIAHWTKRSIWAVYATIGFFAATGHYVSGSPTGILGETVGGSSVCRSTPTGGSICTSYGPHVSPWAPALAYGLLGFWLVGLGMLGRRRKAHKTVVVEAAVVVETTEEPPAAPPAAPPAE